MAESCCHIVLSHADEDAGLPLFNQPTFPECLEGGPKSLTLAGPVNTAARIQKSVSNAVQLRFQSAQAKQTIYPIPATDLLHVVTEGGSFDYMIVDAAGRVALKGRSALGTMALDVSGLAAGRYEFRMAQNGGSSVTSISIVR